jgi:hypothetical protein
VEYPARMSRATVFFRLLILFPHLFYAIGFTAVYLFAQFLTWWTILVVGRMAGWQFDLSSSYFVYAMRLNAYMLFLVDEYPPFNGAQPRAAERRFAVDATTDAPQRAKGVREPAVDVDIQG